MLSKDCISVTCMARGSSFVTVHLCWFGLCWMLYIYTYRRRRRRKKWNTL